MALLLVSLSPAIQAQNKQQLPTFTGGGESSDRPGLHLSGAMFGYTLPHPAKGLSVQGSTTLHVGFYFSLSFALANAADPIWLRLSQQRPDREADRREWLTAGRLEREQRLVCLESEPVSLL